MSDENLNNRATKSTCGLCSRTKAATTNAAGAVIKICLVCDMAQCECGQSVRGTVVECPTCRKPVQAHRPVTPPASE